MDAVEVIQFQQPYQNTGQVSNALDDDETFCEETEEIVTVNPTRPAIDKHCSGCGAQLHCKNSSLPGFLPEELLDKTVRKKMTEAILCRRCHLLKYYNFLINVNVCRVDYESIMSCLRLNSEALVLLIVDITDIPGSIYQHLPSIIGCQKPMIVIANKVDLLPPDAKCGYLKRFKLVVEEAIAKAGFRDHFNILHTALVSAKTGYGIEDLITEIYLKYTNVKLGMRNDIYLIGCTNAGKSSVFNALLQSDLCKVHAIDVVERATTSVWPGTTLSLLKFPVMKPTNYRLELRRRRLLQHRAWLQKEMYSRKLLLQKTKNPNYAVLFGAVQNTFKEKDDDLQPIPTSKILTEDPLKSSKNSPRWSLQDPLFTEGIWCYDTPGTVNDEQVLNLFTLDELTHVLPRRLLRPRTALVPVGYSLLIGGVARVDVEKCVKYNRLLLTTFASDDLPLNCMPTTEVDEFLKANVPTGALVVPCGNNRLAQWPDLESCVFELNGKESGGAVADIVLSSIGWVLVSSSSALIRIRSYTPCGKGMATRSALLPFAADVRGKRIPGTRFYKVKPVEFPVNIRRLNALRKKEPSEQQCT
ncbi:hypothetical protein DICVIV_02415 [Dictyocaulus viviparus]|uniref:G domain-containing protein n=1 Tax=Dictyocaulus viviparus TaxID=29172 RepID=A0A0D8YA06_DICVI|nr:hypothetical protein DICVIV_02415 [Dictyocaulus viviparus]